MKIKNKTNWRTDQMKSIVSRVLKEEFLPAKYQRANVYVEYGKGGRYAKRNGMCGGYAYYNSSTIIIKVPQDQIDSVDFAHVVAHEAAHCRGLRHRDMKGKPDYMRVGDWRDRVAWAADMKIELKAAAKPKEKPDVQIARYQKTVEGIKRWETKLKRATNALRKLRMQKRYYVRALAAKGTEVE